MVLSPKLELRQGQQLVMTPQLQQAIRLLQLSNIELCSYVEGELERNPLLERNETAAEPTSRARKQSRQGWRMVPSSSPPAGHLSSRALTMPSAAKSRTSRTSWRP